MSCICDESTFPKRTPIVAELHQIPRALGTLPTWRNAMLAAMGRQPALNPWRAKSQDSEAHDLGQMWVDWCAYVLDVLCFYDEWIANETYLNTAQQASTPRQLVELLGYIPRPALSSKVWLAVEADGVMPIALNKGTAFRSGEFSGNPQQVFELDANASIDPRLNAHRIKTVTIQQLPYTFTELPVATSSLRAKANDYLLLDFGILIKAAQIVAIEPAPNTNNISLLRFGTNIMPPIGQPYNRTRILGGGNTIGPWQLGSATGETAVVSNNTLLLDGRANISPNSPILIHHNGQTIAFRVQSSSDEKRVFQAAQTSTITQTGQANISVTSPPIYTTCTRLSLDNPLPWGSIDLTRLTVQYNLSLAAQLQAPESKTLTAQDPLILPSLNLVPRNTPDVFLLQDSQGNGVALDGALQLGNSTIGLGFSLNPNVQTQITPSSTAAWAVPGAMLVAPVHAFGNIIEASRGESVHQELLGFGDPAQTQQQFKLKKKPLSYLPACNAQGRTSTLSIWVDGILWQEVTSFFGVGSMDTVYTVRHDEAGNTTITFGSESGGGAKPLHRARITADYRFGAGKAAPPANAIKQLAKPVAGLRKVHNVLPAFGGSDAESTTEIKTFAPQSALLLGSVISLTDLQAAAMQVAGVRAAQANWRWQADGLRPVAMLTYIGDAQLEPSLSARLRALSEPDAPIVLQASSPQSARLDVDLIIATSHAPEQVIAKVLDALFAPVTLPNKGGILREEHTGPNGPIFLSQLIASIMAIDGVNSVRSILFNRTPFTDTAKVPAPGSHFEFNTQGVWANGVNVVNLAQGTPT